MKPGDREELEWHLRLMLIIVVLTLFAWFLFGCAPRRETIYRYEARFEFEVEGRPSTRMTAEDWGYAIHPD